MLYHILYWLWNILQAWLQDDLTQVSLLVYPHSPPPPTHTPSSANATPEFEGRGGEELGMELSNTLYKVFNNKHSVDLKGLCISAGEHCWVLYVDVLVSWNLQLCLSPFRNSVISLTPPPVTGQIPKINVLHLKSNLSDSFPQLLQCDGNLYDAISVAIKAALFNTK